MDTFSEPPASEVGVSASFFISSLNGFESSASSKGFGPYNFKVNILMKHT